MMTAEKIISVVRQNLGQHACPKCKATRFGTAEYCVCGHKWLRPAKQILADLFEAARRFNM